MLLTRNFGKLTQRVKHLERSHFAANRFTRVGDSDRGTYWLIRILLRLCANYGDCLKRIEWIGHLNTLITARVLKGKKIPRCFWVKAVFELVRLALQSSYWMFHQLQETIRIIIVIDNCYGMKSISSPFVCQIVQIRISHLTRPNPKWSLCHSQYLVAVGGLPQPNWEKNWIF